MKKLEKIFSINKSDKEFLEIDFLDYLNEKIFHFPFKLNLHLKSTDKNIFVCDVGGSVLKFAFYENEKLLFNENKKIKSDWKIEKDFFNWVLKEVIFFISEKLQNIKFQSVLILSYDLRYKNGDPFINRFSKNLNQLACEKFHIRQFFDENLRKNFFSQYINDAIATLLAENINSEYFTLSLIYGTGINISFIDGRSIKITEIANFDSQFLPKNEYDDIIFNEYKLTNKILNCTELMTSNFLLKKYISLLQSSNKIYSEKDIRNIFYARGFTIIVFLLEILNKKFNQKNKKIRIILTGSPLRNENTMKILQEKLKNAFSEIQIIFKENATIEGGKNSVKYF